MRTINTIDELKQERLRLNLHKAFLETEIKNNFNEMKEQLVPLQILTNGAAKVLSSKDNSIVGNSVGYLANMVVKNVIMRKSGFIAKLIIPFIVKNVAGNIAEANKSTITHWLEGVISKFTHKSSEKAI